MNQPRHNSVSTREMDFDDFPVQDKDKTESLVQALGEARYLELVALVPGEVVKVMERYQSIPANADVMENTAAIDKNRDAHTLKGLAGNYGLPRLEHTARRLGNIDLTANEIADIVQRLQICIEEIRSISDRKS